MRRIDIKEFRELGFLQEANRLFFHQLGLALEVEVSGDGTETLGGIWDQRDDPEGLIFWPDMIDPAKADYVEHVRKNNVKRRAEIFGTSDGVQPIPSEAP